MAVLIISNTHDGHIPFVTPHLRRPPIILDATALIDRRPLSYEYRRGTLTVRYDGQDISDVESVWLRRPAKPFYWDLPVAANHVRYSQSALSELLQAIYSLLPNARWVSDYHAIERANSKPYQQSIAHSLALHVPETLYTTDPAAAQAFLHRHGEIITKPLALEYPYTDSGKDMVFLASTMSSRQAYDFSGLHIAPVIFQRRLSVQQEVRVTVVGNRLFAATVNVSGQRTAHVRDWRLGHLEGSVTFHATVLPAPIARKCVRLTELMGLQFGAIDLICDSQGVWWFLEINPNGQWAFIEAATGQPIGQAVAALLESGS